MAGKPAKVTFKVVAPKDITGKKTAEVAYGAGKPGSGMLLDLITNPTDVSFTNLGWREVQGAIKGEGSLAAAPPTITHNTAWSTDGRQERHPGQYGAGNELIGVQARQRGDLHDQGTVSRVSLSRNAVEYTTLDQEFEIFDTDGTMQTRKAGQASDKRKPS